LSDEEVQFRQLIGVRKMRLYGAIQKVEPQDDGTVRVHGIATSEAVDDQGEIVRAEAMRAAIPDYMCFPALREMHQLSAAGTTLEAEVWEDGTTRIVAHVIDPVAVAKVKNRVYRGFSIGGRVTQRDRNNPKAITGLVLDEISLVDRPANPEAIFDCWKAGIAKEGSATAIDFAGVDDQMSSAESPVVGERFNLPLQVWACDVPDHRHLAKADAVRCLSARPVEPNTSVGTPAKDESAPICPVKMNESAPEASARRGETHNIVHFADPGFQPDGRKRYPIDTEQEIRTTWTHIIKTRNAKKYTADQLNRIKTAIVAAWKEKIDKAGPSAAEGNETRSRAELTRALWEIGRITRMTIDLDWAKSVLDLEATVENDDTPMLVRLQTTIAELCCFLERLITDRIDEILGDDAMDGSPFASQIPGMLAMAAGSSGIGRVATVLHNSSRDVRSITGFLLAKAKRSRGDQALLDTAHLACDKCLTLDGLPVVGREHIVSARDHLCRAGAVSIDSIGDDPVAAARHEMLNMAAALLGNTEPQHQRLMDIAHGCIMKLGNMRVCEEAVTTGACQSSPAMDHLEAAHRQLVAAGARCDSAKSSNIGLVSGGRAGASDLPQELGSEPGAKAELGKLLAEIVPALELLTKRVDDIARTPLPALTMAKGTLAISKQQDRGNVASGPELSPEAIAAAFARMSKEEQTLTLIKASYANPIRLTRPAPSEQ
jgi:hypothetical protein